ncbi:MAG: OmpA/MotB domain protein [Bacteroidetes bacterium]|nr:OmpA/MotB domain protein [Bacteroidota bacterium]
MSKKAIYLLGIVLTILIGTLLYCKFCCPCQTTNVALTAPSLSSPFNIKGNGFNFRCDNNFNFAKDGNEIIVPVNDSINVGIDRMKAFLDANPGIKLDVVGYYLSTEKNNTSFENLGLARADAIKNYLVSKGIPADRINTSGELKDGLSIKDNLVLGPVGFSFSGKTSTPVDSTSVASRIRVKPLLFYFETAKSSINLSDDDKKTIEEIKQYLAENPNAKVLATGHSDNVGNRDSNINLSLERANFAKQKLIEFGIKDDKIITNSKGPDVPIADNSTEEGRAKNRRVEITIK